MKKALKHLLSLALVAVMGLSPVACNGTPSDPSEPSYPSATGEMTYKVALNTEKIALNADISSLSGGAVEISAAKGEYDSGQFIVKCDEKVYSYDVTVSDLTCNGAVIAKENIEICKQIYTYCADGKMFTGMYEPGYYPDALIPVEYIKANKEDVIEKDTNQGFWLNVFTPEDAAAGTYTGTITVQFNGNGTLTVPIRHTVYDFALDKAQNFTFKSNFMIWNNDAGFLPYGELTSSNAKYMDYYDKLLEYNACAYTFPKDTPGMWVGYVREYFDKVSAFGIPYYAISRSENDWNYMERYLGALLDACFEDGKNYFSKAYYYLDMFYDEYSHDSPQVSWRKELVRPTIEGCDALEEKLIQSAVSAGKATANCEYFESLRGLRHSITSGWDEEFADLFKLCCPGWGALHYTSELEDAAELMQNKDVEWWSYGTIGMDAYPYPGWEINDTLISLRDLLWHDYENNITGTMYWCVTGFCNWSYYIGGLDAYEKLQDLYTTASHEGVSNGDGYLMYPGAPYGSDEPFASLRLAAYRDGVDDYMYMIKLDSLYRTLSERYGKVGGGRNFVSFLNEQITASAASKLNYSGLSSARDNLASAIVLAESNGLYIEDIRTNGNKIEYSFYANSDVAVSVNGTALTGANAGSGKHYAGSLDITADRMLKLEIGGSVLNLVTAPSGTTVTAFEDEASLSNLYLLNSNDSCELIDVGGEYANSAKVTLHGNNSSDMLIKTFKPCVMLDMTKWSCTLDKVYSIEFDVYNSSSEDVTFTVIFESATTGKVFEYDKLVLKAGEWRRIKVDNLNIVSRDASVLNAYTHVGIRCGNLLDASNRPKELSLYFDNLFVRAV